MCRSTEITPHAAVALHRTMYRRARGPWSAAPVAVGTAHRVPARLHVARPPSWRSCRECMANGATEVDVALNVLAIKSGRLDVAQRELDELVRCAVGKVQLKAVFEHALYTPEEKRAVLQMLRSSRRELCEDPEYAQRPRRPRRGCPLCQRDPRPQCRHQDRRRHQNARARQKNCLPQAQRALA